MIMVVFGMEASVGTCAFGSGDFYGCGCFSKCFSLKNILK
jgi:hypothetical protein